MRHAILVVEDDEDIRKSLVELLDRELRRNGEEIEIKEAGNDADASKLIEQRQFAIVVTDIDLMNGGGTALGGFEVADAAKDRNPDTQIIFVTSWYGRPDHLQRIDRTAFNYFNRHEPNYDQILISSIRKAIRRYENLRATGNSLTVRIPRHPNDPLEFWHCSRGPKLHRCREVSEFDTELWKALARAIGVMATTNPDRSWNALPMFVGREMWNRLFHSHDELLVALGEAKGRGRGWRDVVAKFQERGRSSRYPSNSSTTRTSTSRCVSLSWWSPRESAKARRRFGTSVMLIHFVLS